MAGLLLPPAAGARQSSADVFLAAIAIVENTPDGRRGAAGELWPWQLLPGTRADREKELRHRGIAQPTGYQVALAHHAWLQAELRRRGVEPLPFNLAMAWNCGAAATATGRAPMTSYEYARRVCAVLESMESKRLWAHRAANLGK